MVHRFRRIFRDSHRVRQARRQRVMSAVADMNPDYDVFKGTGLISPALRELEADGAWDPARLDAIEDRLTASLRRLVAEVVPGEAQALADDLAEHFYGRSSYVRSLLRRLNVGASAVAYGALEERLFLVFRRILMDLALTRYELTPARSRAMPSDGAAPAALADVAEASLPLDEPEDEPFVEENPIKRKA